MKLEVVGEATLRHSVEVGDWQRYIKGQVTQQEDDEMQKRSESKVAKYRTTVPEVAVTERANASRPAFSTLPE